MVDQTGGGVPQAPVRITRADGTTVDVNADARGVVTIPGCPPARCSSTSRFPGFVPYDSTVTLRRGNNNQTVTLASPAWRKRWS